MNKKSLTLPMLIALLGVVLMIASVFLPYLTADAPDGTAELSQSLYGEDLTSMSMVTFAKFCVGTPSVAVEGIVMYVFLGLMGIFALLSLLLGLLKKPIPVLVFSVLSVGVFFLYGALLNLERTRYVWGMGYYIYLVAAVVAVAGSIWLKVAKVKSGKQTAIETN